MLNNGCRDNYMLNLGFHKAFATNSHSIQVLRDKCTLQEEQPDIFIVNLTLCVGSLANFTLGFIW